MGISMASRKRITSLKLKNEEGVSRPRQKTSFSFNLEVNTPNKSKDSGSVYKGLAHTSLFFANIAQYF
jgi:hypothetical protein